MAFHKKHLAGQVQEDVASIHVFDHEEPSPENSHVKGWYDHRLMLLGGMPADHLDRVRQHPMWPMWEAVAPTLAYDAAVMGDDASVPTDKAASVTVPALVMDGGASYPFMHAAALALVTAMPQAEHRALEGQTHEVAPQALAPVLVEFFKG